MIATDVLSEKFVSMEMPSIGMRPGNCKPAHLKLDAVWRNSVGSGASIIVSSDRKRTWPRSTIAPARPADAPPTPAPAVEPPTEPPIDEPTDEPTDCVAAEREVRWRAAAVCGAGHAQILRSSRAWDGGLP